MSDYSWDEDLFNDEDFLDDDYEDDFEEEPSKPKKSVKTKRVKQKKEKKTSGGLFGKKKKASEPPEDDFDEEESDGNLNTQEEDYGEQDESSIHDSDFDEDFDEDEIQNQTSKVKKEKKAREHVHGLQKKTREKKPHGSTAGKIAAVAAVLAAVIVAGGLSSVATSGKITELKQANESLTKQIASQAMNVYTAKRDIQKGDELIVNGDQANVELSQVYTSLPSTDYISDTTTGYAQVDIKAGDPVMANDVGDTNPISDMNEAVEAVKAEYNKPKEMPYKISADFIDLTTGETLAESRDLALDSGANEKAFNTEAEQINGYVLKSIQVDKEGVHAYGVSEKSMKEGIVTMYYYTTKGGWGRHEIKGNIRVTFGYVKKDDPSLKEDGAEDVMDDSAWIKTDDDSAQQTADSEEDAATESSDSETADKTSTTSSAKNATAAKSAASTKSTTAKTTAKAPAVKQQETAPAVQSSPTTLESNDQVPVETEPKEEAPTEMQTDEAADNVDTSGASVDTETIGLNDVN